MVRKLAAYSFGIARAAAPNRIGSKNDILSKSIHHFNCVVAAKKLEVERVEMKSRAR